MWALDAGWSIAKSEPSGPKFSCGNRLYRQAEAPADDRGDVEHRVGLVGHGVAGPTANLAAELGVLAFNGA